MIAIVNRRSGSPGVLKVKEVKKPNPKNNEVLIKIHTTTVTAGDVIMRRKFLLFLLFWFISLTMLGPRNPRRKILGHEFAGTIEAVGKDVKLFKIGDQVFGSTGLIGGAYAEYICLKEKSTLTTKPSNMNFEESATVPVGGLTALHFLRKSNIQEGQQILIYGASGSVGTFATQLAKSFGGIVTAVCSTSNIDLVKSLGADKVIDYTKEDFTDNAEVYDVIFDAVGKISSSSSKGSIKENGAYVTVKAMGGEKVEELIYLKEQIEAGKIKSVVDRIFPLEQIVDAHEYVDKGRKKGNVVITVIEN